MDECSVSFTMSTPINTTKDTNNNTKELLSLSSLSSSCESGESARQSRESTAESTDSAFDSPAKEDSPETDHSSDYVHPEPEIADLLSICTIGTGTFGRVELARHRTSSHFYALKILNIHRVVSTRQVSHVHSEKAVLQKLDHPFIIKLHATGSDDRNLYMVLEFASGGELFSYLRASRAFSNSMSRFYAAEITSALQYLHAKNIVYRDLKPENLLLTKDGHIKMADFGFAKELRDRTYTLCGTPEYLAPEIIINKGHNKAVDWWALGILIYEMMAGRPPFRGSNTAEIYDSIMQHKLKFPRSFNLVAKDLVKKLLEVDRTQRIGSMKGGSDDVLQHKWFEKIDWKALNECQIAPPIIPTLYHPGDTGNFDSYDEPSEEGPMSVQRERDLFENW